MADKAKFDPSDSTQRAVFLDHLVKDIEALEMLVAERRFDTGTTRIGVEQEMCLIDRAGQPSMTAMQILERLGDDHFTTELACFNLEANLDPQIFTGTCLGRIEHELQQLLGAASDAAATFDARVLLTGILPTVRDSDIIAENMTPVPRYTALNDALRASRGSDFSVYIRGVDELITRQATILYEGCNTSFQVHYQIDPERFADHYNWAQLIAAPVLACATNSPIFLGKQLWRETRIALFHQSTDDRRIPSTFRRQRSRVGFGWRWETETVAEYFKDLVCRYRALLTPRIESDSIEDVRQHRTPQLKALNSLNGTVYAWNRPCYGITEGQPHIRLENRYLPAGPTVLDEIANAALWLGLMHAMPDEISQWPKQLAFENVHDNFLRAARHGLGASFEWPRQRSVSADVLLRETLLPMAHRGLQRAELAPSDIKRYLDVIEQRIDSGRTGSQWMLDSLQHLRGTGTAGEAMTAITQGIYSRQQRGDPVHTWQTASLREAGGWKERWSHVEQLMSNDLITVRPDDPFTLVRHILRWSSIRHLPVENDKGELLGMISTDTLIERVHDQSVSDTMRARDVMDARTPATVTPDTPIRDALQRMTEDKLSCLPVLANGKLVGLVTEHDCLRIAKGLASDE
jgi:CBS domain-containing protein/gamma-glutamyl:cysteine ligase YbdK (ATP-grasp superfamily)